MSKLKQLWNSFNLALSTYSNLPAAQCEWKSENKKYVLCFFPMVGIVIGLLSIGWCALAHFLAMRAVIRNVILLLIPLLIAGGIHVDGFLDTCDALSSWRSSEDRIEILRDSNVGSFAVICGIAYFFLLYAVLDSSYNQMIGIYSCGFVISRAMSSISLVTFPFSSEEGTAADFSKSADKKTVCITSAVYILITGILMILISPLYAIAASLGIILSFVLYYYCSLEFFGGINGDLAGFFLEICELMIPLMVLAVSFIA